MICPGCNETLLEIAFRHNEYKSQLQIMLSCDNMGCPHLNSIWRLDLPLLLEKSTRQEFIDDTKFKEWGWHIVKEAEEDEDP